MTEVKKFIVLVTSEQNVYETLSWYGEYHKGVPVSFNSSLRNVVKLKEEEAIFARAAAKFQPIMVFGDT